MDGAAGISPAGYLVLVWLGADRGVCDTQTLCISAALSASSCAFATERAGGKKIS